MYKEFMSKQGMVTTYLARDILSLSVGDKIPTIADYVDKLNVSRGVVQQAINFLVERKAISLYKGGKNGSTLTACDKEILQQFTGWDSISGTMPVPFSTQFISLATALYNELSKMPMPFSFAYISGAETRYEQLKKGYYDFIVVSQLSANQILQKDNDIEVIMTLDNCEYSSKHFIYFTNNDTTIRDGLRVGIDDTCIDQMFLTEKIFGKYNVEYVKLPYITLATMTDTSQVDCFICRYEKNIPILKNTPKVAIDTSQFNDSNPEIPVLLGNKNNYGLKAMIEKYFNEETCGKTQKQVISGTKPIEFF